MVQFFDSHGSSFIFLDVKFRGPEFKRSP